MTIPEKVAYLKGLAEGMGLDTEKSKEAKLISVMIGILEEVGLTIEDIEETTLALGEEIDDLADSMDHGHHDFPPHHHHHHDMDCCGHDDFEDDFVLDCPSCNNEIPIDDDAFEQGFVECESCHGKFSLHIPGEGEEDICGDGCGCCGD